jgi:hypothetical protein
VPQFSPHVGEVDQRWGQCEGDGSFQRSPGSGDCALGFVCGNDKPMSAAMRSFVAFVALAAGWDLPHQPDGYRGGYSEQQINANTWAVLLLEHSYTGTTRTREGALRRAAEPTVAAGGVGFIVREGGTRVSSPVVNQPVMGNRIGYSTVCNGGPRVVSRPGTTLVVSVLSAEEAAASATAAGALVYDARMLLGGSAGSAPAAAGN